MSTKKEPKKLICPECGEKFIQYNEKQKFCCKACKNRYNAKLRKRSKYKKICKTCGKAFETIEKNAKYCSRDCANKGREKLPEREKRQNERESRKRNMEWIVKINKEAQKAGLKYGDYVAMMGEK